MKSRITTIHDFVVALGGEVAVANQFGLTQNAVQQWIARDHIASGYHLPLLALSRRRGLNVSPKVFGFKPEDVQELFHVVPSFKAVA